MATSSGSCGFPLKFPSPMPSHAKGKGRALHDIAIGFFLAFCPPASGVTLFDIGLAASRQQVAYPPRPALVPTFCISSHRIAPHRTASHRIAPHRTASHRNPSQPISIHRRWRTATSASPSGGGFLEIRPRIDLGVDVAACLRGVHFGSGVVSAKQRDCGLDCPAGAALSACMGVMHAHVSVRPGGQTQIK
jgi:hypothetical protein